jgi:hypothetical protein
LVVRRQGLARLLDEVGVHVVARAVADAEHVVGVVDWRVCIADYQPFHPACELLISAFLLSSPIQRLLRSHGVHCRIKTFIVEPGTIATLPADAADHAEFGGAAAGHVVATFLQLDHGAATVASLPALLLGDLDEFSRGGVFGTFAGFVGFVVAEAADFCAAKLAFTYFASGFVCLDVLRFDPFTTTALWAVYSIPCCVFLELPIPGLLEGLVEESVDVLEGDVIGCATSWWHVRWIRD